MYLLSANTANTVVTHIFNYPHFNHQKFCSCITDSIIWQHIKLHSHLMSIFYVTQNIIFVFQRPVTCHCKPTSFYSKSAGNFWLIEVLKTENPFLHNIHSHQSMLVLNWYHIMWFGKFPCFIFYASRVISTPIFPMHRFNLSYSECWIHPSLGWLKDLHMGVYMFSASVFVSSTILCCCCKLIFLTELQLTFFLT